MIQKIIPILLISLLTKTSYSQMQNYYQAFKNLYTPEKIWIISHPFVALKTFKITSLAKNEATLRINDPDLDGDYSGGQVDAFRHCLWMALLTKEIGQRKALKLGIAHEKSNKIQFQNMQLEEEFIPDSISCQMDLLNNKVGSQIGKENKTADYNTIIQIVKNAILSGQCWKIKKDTNLKFLDVNNQVIPKNMYHGIWVNSKVLVPSNY